MASVFPIEKLVEPPFSQRLRGLLLEARQSLHLSALVVAELAAHEGRVLPTWRQWCPWTRAPEPPSLEVFEQLVTGEPVRRASKAEIAALGAPFDDCHAATLVVLSVSPPLSSRPDALLIVSQDHDAPLDAALLSELKLCLEHGLSADRQTRLAEVVFHAVQQAADPIELTDSEARLLYANAAWERTFGYAAHEVVGQTVGQLFRDPVAPIHDTAFYQFTLAMLADGRSWSGALACRAKDGTRVFCEPMVSPFAAKEQGLAGNFAVRRNLAQRAQRDAALAIAHHEFRSVLSAIPDGVVVLRDGKIYFVNAAFLSMLGRTEESVIGLAYLDLVYPDDRAKWQDAHETHVVRVRMLRDDGSVRFAEISTAGAVSFEGRPAMILLSRDLTEHRVTEEQLARAERLAALGSLAAGVAHEINNPLAYVLLNLRHIHGTSALLGPTRDALLEAIEGAARIQNIVIELRGFTGADAPGPPEPVDVAKAATSAINIASNEIRHRARLERRLNPRMYVLAREGQLVQVLVNLLVNAAQAIPERDGKNHVITVTSEIADSGLAVIEISDTGVGVAPDVLAHVFEPFATTKRRGEGSGLGLTISKRIVEELQGQISIRSTVGEGSTVRVELPLARADSQAPAPRTLALVEPPAPPVGRRLRLLVVDDEATIATTLQRVLSQYEITVAADASAAMEILKTGQVFDVILCDLMMPGVSGPEFYDDVCGLNPMLGSKFVFMTGGAFTGFARDFLAHTGCPILMKPFIISTACHMLEQVVAQHA